VQHHAAFPDGVGTIEYTVAEGDRVAIRVAFRGTQQGTFLGPMGSIAATGRPVTWTEITILRAAADRIVEETTEIDWLRVFQQLGVVPTNA
jgi:predicted ester cyclase